MNNSFIVNSFDFIVPLFLIVAGFCLYAMINHLLFWIYSQKKNKHIVLALMCFSAFTYLLCNAFRYKVDLLDIHIIILKVQGAVAPLVYASLAWIISTYNKNSKVNKILFFLYILAAVIFIINLISPFSIFYSEISSLSKYSLPWGELAVKPIATNGPFLPLVYLQGYFTIIFGIIIFYFAYRKKHQITVLYLLIILCMSLFTGIIDLAIDLKLIKMIYLSDITIGLFLSLFILVFSQDLWIKLETTKHKLQKLNLELEERVVQRTETLSLTNEELKISNNKLEAEIIERKNAEDEVNVLNELLPICSNCKKIRNDKGYWLQIETYIEGHTDSKFSHSICQECSDKLYGDEEWYKKSKQQKKKPE